MKVFYIHFPLKIAAKIQTFRNRNGKNDKKLEKSIKKHIFANIL